MHRAVIDPGVFVSALITPTGPPGGIVRAIRAQQVQPVVCPGLLRELAGVLIRPKFHRYATPTEASSYIDVIAARADHYPDPIEVPARSRDPKDDYLLALADTTNVDAIVSGDADLLTLTTTPPVMTPREFLDLLRQD